MSKSLLGVKRVGGPWGLRSIVSLLTDSVGFQRRGHESAGPVFSTRVFGRELFFVDIGGDPELAHTLLWAKSEHINLAAAYHDLFGRLFGEELFIDVDKQVRQGLTLAYIKRHVQATHVYLREYLDGESGLTHAHGTIDGVEFFSDLVLHTLMNYLCKDELCEQIAGDVAKCMATLENDYSVIGLMLPVDTPARRRRVAARERLVALFEALVRHRLGSPHRHEDFLQHLVDTKVGVIDDQAVRDLALRLLGIVFGAHTNTSMSVPAVLLDLLDHPDRLSAIREEIAAHSSDRGEVEFADLRKLTHLHRCITETLRLKSNGIMWRKAIVDVEIGGRHIPAGSILGASTGLINLDPARFEAAQSYCPARYDSERQGAATTDQFQSPPVVKSPVEYCAFGTGRNVCSGRQLAYTLLASIFIRLLSDFDWTVEARPRAWVNMFGPGVARPFGPIEFGYRRR